MITITKSLKNMAVTAKCAHRWLEKEFGGLLNLSLPKREDELSLMDDRPL